MSDLLYPLSRSGDGEELRYSLRSAVANLPHDRVFIVGPRLPRWAKGLEHIPTREGTAKWRNLVEAMRTACAQADLGPDVVYMNDDFFVMEPLDTVPAEHRGPLQGFGTSGYAALFGTTDRVLRELNFTGSLRSYELHTPFAFRRGLMSKALEMVVDRREVIHLRSLYGNVWGIGGEQVADVKIRSRSQSLPAGPFVSTNSTSWRGLTGATIRATFTEPSPYEA